MKAKRCLLITGTVVPNSNYVTLTNVEKRLEEYYKTIHYYSSVFENEAIYFLENSDYDFSSNEAFLKLFRDKAITLMKFSKSDKYDEGKGFQEFEMLDKAVDELNGKYDYFIKITGRYIVRNLKEVVNDEVDGLIIEQHKKKKVALTNVFCSTFDFYNRYLKGVFAEANDSKGVIIEQVVYKKIKASDTGAMIKLFRNNLQLEGISGSYGAPIQRNKLKMKIRGIERKLLQLFGVNEFLIEY